MKVLGISAFYHDSAAALLVDGKIVAAAQEERFTRKKHDKNFPKNAVEYCLSHQGIHLDQLDAIVFYDKPFLKFERLLETYYAFSPRGLISYLTAMPVWIKEKIFLKRVLLENLEGIGKFERKKVNLLFPEHHLSHAASAFYPSPFEEAAILTIDGVGEWATASISHGKGKDISILKELRFPHSVGLLYSAFTYYLGFKVNSGEYKLMGLAPYGNPHSEDYKNFVNLIYQHVVEVADDGSIWLNQELFDYSVGLRMCDDDKWAEIFGVKKREPESELTQKHCDLALAIQFVTEDIVIKMAKTARQMTGARYLCLAGGVALNCVANGKLLRENIFDDIWIQPAAGDAGGALGAAYCGYHIALGQPRHPASDKVSMCGTYLGPEFSDIDTEKVIRKYGAEARRFTNFDDLCSIVSSHLQDGKVVGWCQDRMEWGPRSLGNRSILGDPRNPEMQKKLNLKIKYRESFRPFAPSVLREKVADYFELEHESPYMLLVAGVRPSLRKTVPANYHQLPLKDKLYFLRSELPAITHLDYSARVQTVDKETNPKYWKLLNTFGQKTNTSVLVNTSFNVRGEPIVCTPDDSYRCFMRTEMDVLVVGNYVFEKTQQPMWMEKDNWKEEYTLD